MDSILFSEILTGRANQGVMCATSLDTLGNYGVNWCILYILKIAMLSEAQMIWKNLPRCLLLYMYGTDILYWTVTKIRGIKVGNERLAMWWRVGKIRNRKKCFFFIPPPPPTLIGTCLGSSISYWWVGEFGIKFTAGMKSHSIFIKLENSDIWISCFLFTV